ncbi:Arginase [Golovinomyces cichoracearum]|uniref:Arginase n=1 Tax=Golovinomyces cichoracearum TaxID=62708 RepID=A0A420J6M8_9PEZI|nr:Arginase [Golovinomyces cichoracearum]
MTDSSSPECKFLSNPKELGVVAVGFSGGQGKAGVDDGPSAILATGLLDQVQNKLGYKIIHDNVVHNYDDLIPKLDPDYRGMKNPLAVSAVTQKLSEQVYNHAKNGRRVLTLGGDHSIAIGTISGTAKAVRERFNKDIAVIWVDAHGDINTPESSDSGNIHGMPVAFLAGLAKEERSDIFGWLAKDNLINLSNLVYIGLRDLDQGEKDILRKNEIKAFTMHDIDRYGIGKVMDMTIAYIGYNNPIHLSFDVDAIDPTWAPSTGTPVRGGLTLREGDFIAEYLYATENLIAMDLVEVNPTLAKGHDNTGVQKTIHCGCSLIRCALGESLI